MRVIAAFAILLSVSACQSLGLAAPEKWYHNTKTAADFEVDKRECEYDAQKNVRPSGSPLLDQNDRVRIFSACMRSRGYTS